MTKLTRVVKSGAWPFSNAKMIVKTWLEKTTLSARIPKTHKVRTRFVLREVIAHCASDDN